LASYEATVKLLGSTVAAAAMDGYALPTRIARIMKLTTKQKINRRWKIKRRAKRKAKRGL
jgi:hypothetical protein